MTTQLKQATQILAQPFKQTKFNWSEIVKNPVRRGALLYWAALLTTGAAIIHFIGALTFLPQSGLLAAFSLGLALVQIVLASAVVVAPARNLLAVAASVEGVATLVWILARNTGLPIGLTLWRPQVLGAQDFYLPVMEGVSAFFLLCLFGRTWTNAPRPVRRLLAWLPTLVVIGFIVLAGLNFGLTEVNLVVLFFTAGLPGSLFYPFLPLAGLMLVFLLVRLPFKGIRARTPGAGRTVLILLPALLLVSLSTWVAGTTAALGAWFPVSEQAILAPAGQTTTLAYCSPDGGSPLAMDLTEPAAQAKRPAPVVFYIHGGEGLVGSRVFLPDADGTYFMRLRDELVQQGFVVGSIDYRLAPINKLKAQVEDAKCAVRFLRAHATELGIDPQRIGVYGASQGGYLAAMLGTAGPQTGYEVGQYLEQSSRVQAVVDMWGFTDLTNFSGSPSWVGTLGASMAGNKSSSSSQSAKASSPVNNVAPGDPPFLIIHGLDDWFIAPHHSQDLARLLQAAKVPATLVLVQHDGHGLNAPTAGEVEQPSPGNLVEQIKDFFVRTLAARAF